MSTSSLATRPRPRIRPIFALLVAGGLIGGAVAVALYVRSHELPPVLVRRDTTWTIGRDGYAGTGSCRECHKALCDVQAASSHALTVRDLRRDPPRAPFATGQGVVDPDTGARYEMVKEGGRSAIAVERAGARASQPLDYEFGAGHKAHAYVARLSETEYLDARLNYYKEIGRWDFTSGQEVPMPTLVEQPLGRPLSTSDTALCFSCHATVLRGKGATAAGVKGDRIQAMPDRSILGITCERCHGPRAEHVRLAKSGKPPGRSAMSAQEINDLCAECHTGPEVTASHKAVARFQPFGLARSRCFKESGGKLSCLSCHDPHENARRDEAFYVGKCLECHSRTAAPDLKARICPVNSKDKCVGCHMPKDAGSMLHVEFVDHFIRVPVRAGQTP
jgi:hypothetical protein